MAINVNVRRCPQSAGAKSSSYNGVRVLAVSLHSQYKSTDPIKSTHTVISTVLIGLC